MYVVNQSFKASSGITYRMGDIIDDKTYASFSAKDKAKCKPKKQGVNEMISETEWD